MDTHELKVVDTHELMEVMDTHRKLVDTHAKEGDIGVELVNILELCQLLVRSFA